MTPTTAYAAGLLVDAMGRTAYVSRASTLLCCADCEKVTPHELTHVNGLWECAAPYGFARCGVTRRLGGAS